MFDVIFCRAVLGLLHVLFVFFGKTELEVFVTNLSSPDFKVRFESCRKSRKSIRSAVGFPEVTKCFPFFLFFKFCQELNRHLMFDWLRCVSLK